MTHWKKIVSDPNYIGEADFQEGEEKVLNITKNQETKIKLGCLPTSAKV